MKKADFQRLFLVSKMFFTLSKICNANPIKTGTKKMAIRQKSTAQKRYPSSTYAAKIA